MRSAKSSLRFPVKLRCFDPSASLMRAGVLLLAVTAFLVVAPSSVYVASASLLAAILGSLVLSRRDRRRFSCTSLLLSDCRLLDLEQRRDAVHGVLLADGGLVGGLRLRMRLRMTQPVGAGMRRLPLALTGPGSVIRWQDGVNDVALEGPEEVLGAISVVARGGSPEVEVLYGSRSGGAARVLAVRFASSEGAVQSWERDLLPHPGFGSGVLGRVLPRLRPEKPFGVPAQQ